MGVVSLFKLDGCFQQVEQQGEFDVKKLVFVFQVVLDEEVSCLYQEGKWCEKFEKSLIEGIQFWLACIGESL